MLRLVRFVLLIAACAVPCLSFSSEFKSGEVIVKYKSGIIRARTSVNSLYSTVGVERVTHYSSSMAGLEHLVLKEAVNVQDAIAILMADPSVEYAQPNYLLKALPVRPRQGVIQTNTPYLFSLGLGEPSNPIGVSKSRPQLKSPPQETMIWTPDPELEKVYALEKTKALQAWEISKGRAEVIVADIDTGIDYNHEDLALNIWHNPNPTTKNDIVGFDFVHNDGLPYDDNGHGTHTAGTIGAVGGNGVGISGISQRVSLMALKFMNHVGQGDTTDAIRAINYAVDHGAKILSNSWSGSAGQVNLAIREAITRAQKKNVLFIAASGNGNEDTQLGDDNDGPDAVYPAAFDNENLIAVAATDQNDMLASFSNYGKTTTHLAAPGVHIYSTVPGDQYRFDDGTSMACPLVAGAAALLWSEHPSWNYLQIKEALLNSVDKLPDLIGKTVSGGRLNILKALKYVGGENAI